MALKKSTLEKAVKEMQIYLGSIGRTRLPDEQKLYKRAMKSCEKVSDESGVSLDSVFSQVEAEARRRGAVMPSPGRHI